MIRAEIWGQSNISKKLNGSYITVIQPSFILYLLMLNEHTVSILISNSVKDMAVNDN